MVISQHQLGRQLAQTLGQPLSDQELSHCLNQIQILDPTVGKRFWRSSEASPGLYLILAGKVRLIDGADTLITSLQTGSSFGALTLFPEEDFQSYSARASQNLKLAYLNQECLQTLIHKYASVRDHLHHQAVVRDQLLRSDSAEVSQSDDSSVEPSSTLESSYPLFEPTSRSHAKQTVGRAYFPTPIVKVGHWWRRVSGHYPFFEQQSASDCGVACLVMVGRYWGKRFSVNQLRSVANVNRDGSSLRGLITAAETIGFSHRPVKADLNSLARQPLPAIVHWQGNHYIVVYQVTHNRVIVADPAMGQRSLSHEAFQAGWAGYTLLLQPTAFFQQAPEAKQNIWKFFKLVKPHWVILLEIVFASIMIQIFGLFTPLFTQLLLDRVVVQRSTLTLTAVGIGLLLFSLFRVAMSALRRYLIYHTANRLDLSLIIGFINHTLRLPLSFFESRYVGDITSRVRESRKIRDFLTGEALTTVLDLMAVFVYVGLMFWYSWQMALLALVIVPVFTLLALIAAPLLRQISREIFNAKTVEGRYLIEALSGIGAIKAMGIEPTVRWRWEDLLNQSIRKNFSGQILRHQLRTFSTTIETLAKRGLLLFGVWQVIHDQLTIGQLVAFNMLLSNVIRPFRHMLSLWNEFQDVSIAMERINDVIDAEPEEDTLASFPSLPTLQGRIRFEQVTFRYHPEAEINTLENLSFEIQPGQTVAIVGRSGSGKTTISKLILGLYPVTEGKIWIDGREVNRISLRSLRRQIGVVEQKTFLFGGSIRENISVACPNATLEEIRSAARQAGADQFIQALPMKYDTQIGEGGGLLSGGQRQRLAIARALMGNPRLLILDEATSNLDAESEQIIQTNLNTILQGRTTLVIAHRLSTVCNADLILVLDRGVLVERGTHTELMAKRGQYFYLNQQQLAVAG
ncbi:MAG: peptidase domain-containing ABC transporter [Leptolyngbyaceae cyanobacterium MO_188.B28]|nr:peptidase domain-containing ABC transporter [Leptolyngbyaceae cyanobacterium MO_188.B28]